MPPAFVVVWGHGNSLYCHPAPKCTGPQHYKFSLSPFDLKGSTGIWPFGHFSDLLSSNYGNFSRLTHFVGSPFRSCDERDKQLMLVATCQFPCFAHCKCTGIAQNDIVSSARMYKLFPNGGSSWHPESQGGAVPRLS
jgi:hypothetical protein